MFNLDLWKTSGHADHYKVPHFPRVCMDICVLLDPRHAELLRHDLLTSHSRSSYAVLRGGRGRF